MGVLVMDDCSCPFCYTEIRDNAFNAPEFPVESISGDAVIEHNVFLASGALGIRVQFGSQTIRDNTFGPTAAYFQAAVRIVAVEHQGTQAVQVVWGTSSGEHCP